MAHDLKANLETNNPFDKLKNKSGVHKPTISNPYITQSTAPQQAPTEEIKTDTTNITETKSTTTKGLKKDYTRHTFEIKKDHLKLLQALARHNKIKISEALTDLLDFAFNSISEDKKKKALEEIDGGRLKLI